MKKTFIRILAVLIILTSVSAVSVTVVVRSVVHVRLAHGAVLHVFPCHWFNRSKGAVILCPGGGYSYLETWREGYRWFPFFLLQGYTPALLEYRMPKGDCETPVTDGAEAIEVMRKHAGAWHYDAHNVGIAGFSAGGHLASTLLVTDREAVRPDFGILFYPVISMDKRLTHMDTHDQLLGRDATESLEMQFSNELLVTKDTPPVFIAVARDDKAVSYQGAVKFSKEMQARKRPVSLHVYPSGGHGFVCRPSATYRRQALDALTEWLSGRQE